ncbi:TPA: hypothetical protein ACGGJH_004073, partial [Escherichia coli]
NYYHNTPGANCTGSQNLFNACRIPLFTIDKKSFSYLFLSVKCGVMKEWLFYFHRHYGGIADIFLRYKYAVFMACTR